MGKHVLIVESDPIFRAGLRTILSDNVNISKISELATCSEITQSPELKSCDISIIHQSAIHDMNHLPKSRIIILTGEFNKHILFTSYALGAQGYLYEKPSLDLLFYALNLNENEFLLDPIFTPWLLKGTFKDSIPSASYDVLTVREREVFELLRNGLTYRSIAEELTISVATVKTHTTHIFRKLGVKRRPGKLPSPQDTS